MPLYARTAEEPEMAKNGTAMVKFSSDANVINALVTQSNADHAAIIVKLTFMVFNSLPNSVYS